KSAQIREILISESAWEEMTCLFAPSVIYAIAEKGQNLLLADKPHSFLFFSFLSCHVSPVQNHLTTTGLTPCL
ncbi:hypothetical protein ACJWUM_27910, partial [Klebsiella pneumoniae]